MGSQFINLGVCPAFPWGMGANCQPIFSHPHLREQPWTHWFEYAWLPVKVIALSSWLNCFLCFWGKSFWESLESRMRHLDLSSPITDWRTDLHVGNEEPIKSSLQWLLTREQEKVVLCIEMSALGLYIKWHTEISLSKPEIYCSSLCWMISEPQLGGANSTHHLSEVHSYTNLFIKR